MFEAKQVGFTVGFLFVIALSGITSLASAQSSPPSIVSGEVLTKTVNVIRAPAAPAVRVQYSTQDGLASIDLQFASDVTSQTVDISFNAPQGSPKSASGTIVLQTPNEPHPPIAAIIPTTLGLYAATGTWTLVSAKITDQSGHTTTYVKYQLSAIFPTPSFQVINPAGQDITPPSFVSGTLLTPTVSLSSAEPALQMKLDVTDDRSGVTWVQLTLAPPGSYTAENLSLSQSEAPRPIRSGSLFATALLYAAAPVGTWQILEVYMCDVAGNCNAVNGKTQVTQLLGTSTFTVTK